MIRHQITVRPPGPSRARRGPAVDPVALEPVDEIVITTLVNNVYDGLLAGDERTTRAPVSAGVAEPRSSSPGNGGRCAGRARVLRAGQRAPRQHDDTLLSTPGCPRAMVTNAGRLGADLSRSRRWSSATATSITPGAWPGSPAGAGPGHCRW